MLASSNKERLEQEIANLIRLISLGREVFFTKTGHTLDSSDNFLDHFVSKELFQTDSVLIQLELNIQLLYVKLSSYYQLTSSSKATALKKLRNAFSHELTDLIFNKRVHYNFFLHKVTENFKKVLFIFYEEDAKTLDKTLTKTLILDLDLDINNFLSTWSKLKTNRH